jgi:5S rRNA maturation endonuclease (ribonuclease M5)
MRVWVKKALIATPLPRSPPYSAIKAMLSSRFTARRRKLRFQFGGKKPRPYCFGLNQLPFRGDMVFITGGEKDVLTLVSHGFSAVCFNSETAEISTDILDMLAMRFKHIFILYDMDDTGRKVMDKAEQELVKYDVRQIHLPLEGQNRARMFQTTLQQGTKPVSCMR